MRARDWLLNTEYWILRGVLSIQCSVISNQYSGAGR